MYTTITLIFVWHCRMVITMSYFALLLNTTNLHGDPYFNFFLSAVVEIPAYIMASLLLKFCHRRFCQSSTLFLGGVIILFIQVVPRGECESSLSQD